MNALDKLVELSGQMELEPAEEARGEPAKPACFTPQAQPGFTEKEKRAVFVHPAQLPNGKQIRLLKTLLTSACERDCYYCPFRAGRDFRRATFRPQEFAELFMKLNQSGAAEGIFLSSGIAAGGANTQNRILDTAEILRTRLGYRGYMHLKIMPGAEKGQVERLMQLADRVSINLEAPNTERLARLAPGKTFIEELFQPLRWVEEIRRTPAGLQGLEWPLAFDGHPVRRRRLGRERSRAADHHRLADEKRASEAGLLLRLPSHL